MELDGSDLLVLIRTLQDSLCMREDDSFGYAREGRSEVLNKIHSELSKVPIKMDINEKADKKVNKPEWIKELSGEESQNE